MSRRTDRVDSLVRQTLGQLLLTKLSDPRVDPARTAITNVTVSEDLASAKVYVSVIGSKADQRKALAALRHAAGYLQELMMREVSLRQTPVLNFILDTEFKKAMETLEIIDQAMAEIRSRQQDVPCGGEAAEFGSAEAFGRADTSRAETRDSA